MLPCNNNNIEKRRLKKILNLIVDHRQSDASDAAVATANRLSVLWQNRGNAVEQVHVIARYQNASAAILKLIQLTLHSR
jgi:uncharacterized protein YcbK (DUF882 family)